MSSSEDKNRWKRESEQLKNDLKKRKKVIKKREVDIKFPKKNPPTSSPTSSPPPNLDDYYKQQINLNK